MPQISTKSLSRSAACAVMIAVVLLFLCPASVVAMPVSEYQQHLKNALTSLETLYEMDEEELPADFDTQFNDALEKIRTTLPRNLTVELDGEVCNVDNSWLHQDLDELKHPATRFDRLSDLIENLKAMDARLTERQNSSHALESKDDAKNRLKSILTRPEYASQVKGPSALKRLVQQFFEWLSKLFPQPKETQPGSGRWFAMVLQVVVLLAGLAMVVFIVRLLVLRLKRTKRIKPRKKQEPRIVLGERLQPEQTSTDLLSEAEALARSGDLRAAIRKAYIALLVELGDRNIISLAQHKTNRDYLNGLRNLPPLHSRMTRLTSSFERHWYGFVEANQNDWQSFREGYLAALQKGN